MFFTGTIRRTLLSMLLLVGLTLLIATFSGVTGLQSYRAVVAEFDRLLNKTPNKAHLAAGITPMLEVLQTPPKKPLAGFLTWQAAEFDKRWKEADSRLQLIARRVDDLSPTELTWSQRELTQGLLAKLRNGMNHLTHLKAGLAVPSQNRTAVAGMRDVVCDLQILASRIPDPADELGQTLNQARTESKSKLRWLWGGVATTILIMGLLIHFGYTKIYDPIRRLHQGALRVAHGDLDFRLKVTTKDEMGELAESFNEMTSRFQEIRGDLDRQVHERSQQLVRSERLANVGFLSAGVAHEINNPLSAISMAAESIADRVEPVLRRLKEDPDRAADAEVIRQYLTMIQDESVRCRQITERLLDFSRGRDHVREMTDLTRLIQEVVAMVQHLGKFRDKHIVFEQREACLAEINGAEIKQVVLNLVANGLESMPKGKTLRIQITEQTDHVRLQFTDEGCGMTPDVLEKIFEPFFTQKQVGQGTGLGLSISHRIVNQHGGSIDVWSPGPGQGSTFCVRLPRRAAQRGAA